MGSRPADQRLDNKSRSWIALLYLGRSAVPIEIGKLILRFSSSFEPAAVGRRVTMRRGLRADQPAGRSD